MIKVWTSNSCSFTAHPPTLTHSVSQSLTHSITHPLSQSVNHSLTHPLTHPHTIAHSLTQSFFPSLILSQQQTLIVVNAIGHVLLFSLEQESSSATVKVYHHPYTLHIVHPYLSKHNMYLYTVMKEGNVCLHVHTCTCHLNFILLSRRYTCTN